jgi:hypothetical protein
MQCEIVYKRKPNGKLTNEIKAVMAPNNEPSILFEDLKNHYKHQGNALRAYYTTRMPEFESILAKYEYDVDKNGEVVLNNGVVNLTLNNQLRYLDLLKGEVRLTHPKYDLDLTSSLDSPVDSFTDTEPTEKMETYSKAIIGAQASTVNNIVSKLKERFGVKAVFINDIHKQWAGKYSKDGTIILNEAYLANHPDAMWHEFIHPLVDTLSVTNKDLYNNLKKEVDRIYNSNSPLRNKLIRIFNDSEYLNDKNELSEHGYKEAITELVGIMTTEAYTSKEQADRIKPLFKRFMTWLSALFSKLFNRSVDLSKLDSTTTLLELGYLVGATDSKFDIKVLNEIDQYRKTEPINVENLAKAGYSEKQLAAVRNLNASAAKVGEPIMVPINELPVKLRKIYQDEEHVMLYERKDGSSKKYWLNRVSARQKALFQSNKTYSEAVKKSKELKSQLGRTIGTEMHSYNEEILNTILNEMPFMDEHANMTEEEYVKTMSERFKKTATYMKMVELINSDKTAYAHKYRKKYERKNNQEPDPFDSEEFDPFDYAMGFDTFDQQAFDAQFQGPASVKRTRQEAKYVSDNSDLDDDIQVNGIYNYMKQVRSMLKIYYQVNKIQRKIDPKVKPLFLLEQVILDPKAEEVGSPDVTVIFSDGTFSLYDHKFIELKYVKKEFPNPDKKTKEYIKAVRKRQGLVPEYTKTGDKEINDNWFWVLDDSPDNKKLLNTKTKAYDTQLTRYAEMLREVYGLGALRNARILPFNVFYSKEEVVNPDGTKSYQLKPDSKVQFILTEEDNPIANNLLSPIVASRESTGNEKLDVLIQKLIANKEALEKEMAKKGLWNNPEYVERLETLTKNIMDLQMTTNYEGVTRYLHDLNALIKVAVDIDDQNDPRYLTFKGINSLLSEIDLYSNILDFISGSVAELKKVDPVEASILESSLGNALTLMNQNKVALESLMLTRLTNFVTDNKFMTTEEFLAYQKQEDLGAGSTWFAHLKSINHPLIVTFSRTMDKINYERIKYENDLQKRIKESVDALQEWGKNKGLKGSDIYKSLIVFNENDNDYELIKMYDVSLFKLRKQYSENKTTEAIEWFKNTFHRSTEKDRTGLSDEDRFQALKKEADAFFKANSKTEEEYKKKMNNWLNNNDIYYNNGNNNAWYNTFIWNLMSPKEPSKWYSKEYLEIIKPENKPLLDFYNLFVNEIQRVSDETGISLKKWFIPNVRKTLVDKLAEESMGSALNPAKLKEKLVAIKDQLLDPQDKSLTIAGKNDVKEIPLYFQDAIDPKEKSLDLGRSLFLFASMAKTTSLLQQHEDMILSLRRLAVDTPFITKTAYGVKTIANTNVPEYTKKSNPNLVKAFDQFINYYVYGQKLQEDLINSTVGQQAAKTIMAAQALNSRATMAFNALSASAGYLASRAQMKAMAKKGKYYTEEQLNAATKAMVMGPLAKDNKKAKYVNELFDMLQITAEDVSSITANKLSANKLRKALREDWNYKLHKMADESIERTIFAAMLMNYAIDPTDPSRVDRIDKLKEKYPDAQIKSIWDSIEEIPNGNDTTMKIIDNNGEDISDMAVMSIRRKVKEIAGRVKGQMSDEDIAGYKTSIMGRMLMNYRGWIPATINERLKKEGYNMTMEEYEIGRWRAALNFVKGDIIKNTAKVLPMMIPLIGGRFNLNYNEEQFRKMYEDFILANPELKDKVSYDDYVKEHVGQVKALLGELRMLYAVMLLLLLFGMAWDDDDRKNNPIVHGILSVLDRTILEIGFYLPMDPTLTGIREFTQMLTKAPFPVISGVTTVYNMITNTFTEGIDLITGAGWDQTTTPRLGKKAWTIDTSPIKDNTPLFYYTSNLLGLKSINNMLGIFGTTDKDDTIIDHLLAKR